MLFGDGASYGARLPTGMLNLRAVYRRGLGSGGAACNPALRRPPLLAADREFNGLPDVHSAYGENDEYPSVHSAQK